MTAGVTVLRVWQSRAEPHPDLGFGIVTGSALAGIVAAAASGWLHTRRIDDRWRRGVTGAVSVFGAVVLAVVATPVDVALGSPGLVSYLVLLAVGLVFFHRLAARATIR